MSPNQIRLYALTIALARIAYEKAGKPTIGPFFEAYIHNTNDVWESVGVGEDVLKNRIYQTAIDYCGLLQDGEAIPAVPKAHMKYLKKL